MMRENTLRWQPYSNSSVRLVDYSERARSVTFLQLYYTDDTEVRAGPVCLVG